MIVTENQSVPVSGHKLLNKKKRHFQQENKPDATRNKWGSFKWTGCYLPALYKTIKGHENASDVFASEELY